MHYAVLTDPGTPFQFHNSAPQPPGDPLRVAENATLLAFENQPDLVFASRWANASSKILWHVPEQILHLDDLSDAEHFSSYRDFSLWLFQHDNPHLIVN